MDAEVLDRDDTLPTALENVVDASLAVGLSRAEIDTQIATARRWPRQITKVSSSILSLATLDEETAEESMYALPRGGKPIQGPSIRFAEIVKTSYGNCRAAARVVHVDRVEKVVIAEGVFHDLETNTATRAEVRRRITDRQGRLYKDDMIIVTGNAACSIALRNAILGGVPKALWRKAYEAVQHTIAGDVKTLSETRDRAIKALAHFGVTPEQVFSALGVAGVEDITINHIPTLRGMFATLKNGEATVEEMFVGTMPSRGGAGHEKVENPLSDEEPKLAAANTQSSAPADAGAASTESAAPLNSSGTPQPPDASETKPAPIADDPSSAGAGTPQSSAVQIPAAEERQATEPGDSALHDSVGLPEDWPRQYAAALTRAQKKDSLTKFAAAFWKPFRGWDAHKNGPNAEKAVKTYDAFANHFGPAGEEARNAILRELGAA